MCACTAFAQSQVQITTTSLPGGSVGVSYSAQMNATGGVSPYQWTAAGTSLPPGLSISTSGAISGTPTQTGTFVASFSVADSEKPAQTATTRLPIVIQTAPLSITSSSPLPQGSTNISYTYSLAASGGTPPYNWQLGTGTLPPGLSLSVSGQISGIPNTTGTYQFSVFVYDASQASSSRVFAITIQTGSTSSFAITSPPALPQGSVGSTYLFTFTASGGNVPYTWSAQSTPPGLTLSGSGVLSGTPTTAGTYTFTVQVVDTPPPSTTAPTQAHTAAQSFTLRIGQGLTITTASPLYGTTGSPLNIVMTASGGVLPELWGLATGSTLPPGLTLDMISGFLQGTPTTAGTYNFTLHVTDNINNTATKAITMIIQPPLTITTTSPAPPATAGSAYTLTFAATGGTSPYTWKVDSGTSPQGLALDPATGILSGTPTTAGAFSFVIRVTDTGNTTVTAPFTLSVTAGGPGAQLSITTLSFTAPAGGDAPPPQNVAVISLSAQTLTFTIQTDGGPGQTAPWLIVRLPGGSTPAGIPVSVDQTGLAPGTYTGRVLINTSDGRQNIVAVTLTVLSVPGQLDVSPVYLRFAGTVSSLASAEQDLLIRNIGGNGPITFQASITGDTAWLSVTPASGQAGPNAPLYLKVLVSSQGLAAGARHGVVHIMSAAGSVDVPVSLLVRSSGPVIGADLQGVRFDSRSGNGLDRPAVINILNNGDSLLNWQADVLTSDNFLTLSVASGQTAPGAATPITLRVNSASLAAGGHYALVRISDPNAVNSPLYFTAVVNVQPSTTPPLPLPRPEGLVFVARAGTTPPTQTVNVYASSSATIPYQAAAYTAQGVNWLSVSPTNGMTQTQPPGQVTVSVTTAGLAPGVYNGSVTFSLSSISIQTTNVTLIVQPSAPAGLQSLKNRDAVAGCTPAKLVLTSTGLANSFASPAGWPTPIEVSLSDDCGTAVPNGQVVATFSNGDPPLTLKLTDSVAGVYSGTWSPRATASSLTVSARGNAPNLGTVSANIVGAVTANKVPVLSVNGTVNNFSPAVVAGSHMAPGTVAAMYGSSLAPSTSQPGGLPLPAVSDGTQVLVGAFAAPLYFLSDGQLDVQLPIELQPGKDYSVIVQANGGVTLPDTITTIAVDPTALVYADNSAKAEHGADFSFITASSPAAPGEPILLYMAAMGATNPQVPSGAASPSGPLASLTTQPTVTIGGQTAPILFAGLTPGAVGLYQINVTVPMGLPSGPAAVVITQGGVTANAATLPIK